MNIWRFIAIGGITYWFPDAVIQMLGLPHYVWISLLTFGVPAVVVFLYRRLSIREPYARYPVRFPLGMLIGVWFFAPVAMTLTAILQGSSFFLTSEAILTFLTLWAIFPISTFIMSTYSGSLGGVLLVSIIFVAVIVGQWLRTRCCSGRSTAAPFASQNSTPRR